MPKRGGGEVPAEHWDHPAGLCPVLAPCPCGGPCHSGVTSPRSTQEFCGQMGADGSKQELPMVSQHGLLLGRNRRIRRQQWEQNQDMSKRQHCQGMLASSPAFLDTIMLLEPSHWHQICPMDLDPGDEPATRPLWRQSYQKHNTRGAERGPPSPRAAALGPGSGSPVTTYKISADCSY